MAKGTRPEMCGMASIMASVCKWRADVLVVNKAMSHLRSTAARTLKIWVHDPHAMAFIAVSDAGGINTKQDETDEIGLPTDATQQAWMVLAAEALPVGAQRVKACPVAWIEFEAEAEGVQHLWWRAGGLVAGDVPGRGLPRRLSSQLAQLAVAVASHGDHRGDCNLHGRQQRCSVTDAQSLYDCLMKEHPQGRQDRKASLQLAMIVRDLEQPRSMVRWVPHQKMVVDPLTKPDSFKANAAMEAVLKTGHLALVDVQDELKVWVTNSHFKRRSHGASVARLVEEYQSNCKTLWSTFTWGYCQPAPVGCAFEHVSD